MFFYCKKSFIIDWWVAKKEDKFKFVDITNLNNISSECHIFGRSYAPMPDYIESQNAVIKVTKKGVFTASGRFYPFKSAHPLYLMFLNKIHVSCDTVTASKWECIDTKNSMYVANIEYPTGETMENAIFDFESIINDKLVFIGISNELKSRVVVHTFDMRELSDARSIEGSYSPDIYHSSEKYGKTRKRSIRHLRKLLIGKGKKNKDMGS